MSQVLLQKKWRETNWEQQMHLWDPVPAADSPTASRQRGMVTPQMSRSSPIDRGEISMGDYHSRRESTMEHRGEFTMEQNRASLSYRGERQQATAREGKIRSKTVMAAHPFKNVSSWKRPKCPKVTAMTPFKTLSQDRGEWPSRTLTV